MTDTNTRLFLIWIEGFAATGEGATASFEGEYKGETFQAACQNMIEQKNWTASLYDPERNSFWGCRFFDNEADARKSFG